MKYLFRKLRSIEINLTKVLAMETIGETTLKIPAILILAPSSLLKLSITLEKAWRIFTLFTVNDF